MNIFPLILGGKIFLLYSLPLTRHDLINLNPSQVVDKNSKNKKMVLFNQ